MENVGHPLTLEVNLDDHCGFKAQVKMVTVGRGSVRGRAEYHIYGAESLSERQIMNSLKRHFDDNVSQPTRIRVIIPNGADVPSRYAFIGELAQKILRKQRQLHKKKAN